MGGLPLFTHFDTFNKKWYFASMEMSIRNVLISAGEASGDMYAADLVQNVKKIVPTIRFYGMGANLMKDSGVELIVDANELGIIGILDVVTKFLKIRQAFSIMKNALFKPKYEGCNKPALLILVDYPGFNLRLAKIAKKAGVKVLYFISPKVWVWNQSRIKVIKKYIDMMAVIFPFEVAFYKKFGVPTTFVGNPLLKMAKPKMVSNSALQTFNLDSNCKTIGLFPGSRKSEIKRLLPIMLTTVNLLKKRNPNLQFLLSQASSINLEDLQPYLQSSPVKIQVIQNQNYDVMQACAAIIAASGTVILEIALMAIPLVIIYKTSWLEYQIAKRLIKIPYIGLCNILANKKIVQELLQDDATPENISQEIEKILNNINYHNEMINNLTTIKGLLENSEQKDISQLIIKMIESEKYH